jgi:hypothetical protein
MAAAASASQAHHRACPGVTCAVTAAAAWACAAVEACVCCCASGLACTTTKRRASWATRPGLSSPSPRRSPLWPCQRRGASSFVRPGCSTKRGHPGGCCPQAARSCRPAQVRGPKVINPRPWSRHKPKGRRLEAFLSATIPRTPSQPNARHASSATGVSPLSLRLPSRLPRRTGPPPAPLPPRRRRTGLRSSRPSWLCPEAGRGAPGGFGASADAPYRARVVVS